MQFFSQAGQDQFVFENFFRGRRNGVFVDIGACDGEKFSNSLFFERFMGWRGLRVEPPAGSLSALLEKHSLLHVDFCSIDIKGVELAILSELDLDRFDIGVFAVTNDSADERIPRLMAGKGYDLVGTLAQTNVFKRRSLKQLARTTVICSVWHGDPERWQLLEVHAANLSRQTVPVEMVYVFDGRDEVPGSIPGHKLVAHENLSIYQAWNVGMSLVETPFVMNLNLDDRLAPDAVGQLEAALLRNGAALAGGDWNICYSQEATDAVEPCYPVDRLPFVPDWPPPSGTRTRLGSGTGERGTFGPATLWRMDAHIGAPRYPWRFSEGSVLKVAGDVAWWSVIAGHLKKTMTRLPLIIGNYHSRPGSQAEFRGPQDEVALIDQLGISLI
jgi:hypothetical protein